MLKINPKDVTTHLFHSYMLGAVAPRPIAFASTIDKNNNPNLAPFSFFNVFSANPPIAVFSPARSGRTGETKHTYQNIKEVPEVVINVVNYDIVQQTSLASTEYPKGVSEFVKAGFTPIASELIKPFRVKESPVQFECSVKQVIELGDKGGAGNLIICEILLIHIDENILDEQKNIDPNKINLVGRMGANHYTRAFGQALFEVEKPNTKIGIGIDALPYSIRNSKLLSGNDLGMLANVEKLPSVEEIEQFKNSEDGKNILSECSKNNISSINNIHTFAKKLLKQNQTLLAWKLLLVGNTEN